MVIVLQQALEAGQEDSVKAGFDVFETMLIIVREITPFKVHF